MADQDHDSKKYEEYGFSLGLAALIGKVMNNKELLKALLPVKENKEELYKTVREKLCIELTDCDLESLLKRRRGGLTIIDYIQIALDCLEKHDPPPDPKWCC
jgi:hypothetical protein